MKKYENQTITQDLQGAGHNISTATIVQLRVSRHDSEQNGFHFSSFAFIRSLSSSDRTKKWRKKLEILHYYLLWTLLRHLHFSPSAECSSNASPTNSTPNQKRFPVDFSSFIFTFIFSFSVGLVENCLLHLLFLLIVFLFLRSSSVALWILYFLLFLLLASLPHAATLSCAEFHLFAPLLLSFDVWCSIFSLSVVVGCFFCILYSSILCHFILFLFNFFLSSLLTLLRWCCRQRCG